MQRNTRTKTLAGRLLLGFLSLIAFFLVGCGPGVSDKAQLAADQTFIWPLTHAASFEQLIIDPANTPDIYSASVVNLIFGSLVTTDRNLNVVPNMATWEISPDGQQYTFHLRPNLRFSDGAPLTAQDFAYSLDRALDPQVCVPIFGAKCRPRNISLLDIVGAADRAAGRIPSAIGVGLIALDIQTLIIKLNHPVFHFLQAMTTSIAFPVERSLIEKYGQDYTNHTDWTHHLNEGGCSGPFIIQSYRDGKTLTFVPNPAWYGSKLTIKQIVRPIVLDVTDTYAGYRQGKYEYTDVPTEEYHAARDQGDFREIGLLSQQFLGINGLAPPFTDLNIRRAFALALNKQLIADHVLSGAALPTNHIVPQGQPGFYDQLTASGGPTRAVTGDAEEAQLLIKGYFAQCSCQSLTVTLTFPNDVKRTSVAQAMKAMWETVLTGSWGTVHVNLQSVSFQELVVTDFSATVGHPGPLQMWLIGLSANYPDPYNWLNGVFAPTAPLNVFNYRDDNDQLTAWALMQQADAEQDKQKRLDLYHQAEQQLVNAALEIPYAQEKGIWRIKPYIQGYNPSALQRLPTLDWANVVILSH